MGADRINSCFLSVTGGTFSLPNNFQDFRQGDGPYTVLKQLPIPFLWAPLYLYILNEYVKWISSEEEVISVMSDLCACRKQDVVKILLSDIVCDDKTVEVPHGTWVKVYPFPLEGRANCSQAAVEIGTEQNIFTKSIIAKYLPVTDGVK